MSSADIYEKFIRLAAKSIQRFPSRTRTDMALGMLGWLPMMSYIEQRKLLFLFVLRENKNQSGFIPDIWKVLQKYHLEEYLLSYLATSLFPTKGTWKTIVKHKIRIYYETAWTERVENDADFARFRLIHPAIKMSNIWTISHNKSSFHSALIVARLCTLVPQQNDPIQCLFCGTITYDIYKHTVSACPRFTNERESFIRLISNEVCSDIGNFLSCSMQLNSWRTKRVPHESKSIIIYWRLYKSILLTFFFHHAFTCISFRQVNGLVKQKLPIKLHS